jgi:hypothetical protein
MWTITGHFHLLNDKANMLLLCDIVYLYLFCYLPLLCRLTTIIISTRYACYILYGLIVVTRETGRDEGNGKTGKCLCCKSRPSCQTDISTKWLIYRRLNSYAYLVWQMCIISVHAPKCNCLYLCVEQYQHCILLACHTSHCFMYFLCFMSDYANTLICPSGITILWFHTSKTRQRGWNEGKKLGRQILYYGKEVC